MECQARENELQDRERRIIEGFNDESKLPVLVTQVASRSSEGGERRARCNSQEQRSGWAPTRRDEARKLKQALRMVHAAAGRAFREEEKRILEDEIEKTVTRPAGQI